MSQESDTSKDETFKDEARTCFT